MPANGQHNGAVTTAKAGTGMRARWRHSRSILKEGLEAALRADAEMVEKCSPKTFYGRLIQGLVIEAAKCKATPLKELLSLIDWEPPENDEGEDIQDALRDWSKEGEWLTKPEAAKAAENSETEGAAKEEFRRRIDRLMAGNEADQARAAMIIETLRSAQSGGPEPVPVPTG